MNILIWRKGKSYVQAFKSTASIFREVVLRGGFSYLNIVYVINITGFDQIAITFTWLEQGFITDTATGVGKK